jgi:hypothetical protein
MTDFVDAVQTGGILVNGAALIYVMLLLRNELRTAAAGIRHVIDGQARDRARLDRIETAVGIRANGAPRP